MDSFLNEITREESGELTNFTRMSLVDLEFLLAKIEPMIKKTDSTENTYTTKNTFGNYLTIFSNGIQLSKSSLFIQGISLILPEVYKTIKFVLNDQTKVKIIKYIKLLFI